MIVPEFWLSFVLFVYTAAAVKNQTTINELLPFVQVDPYAPCLRERGDAYCFVSAKLGGEVAHAFYNALVEHSENKLTHFDRTNVYRGICIKTTCNEYNSSNTSDIIESCLNTTLYREHGLTARVFKSLCSEYREAVEFDASDVAFGVVVLGLVALNLFGSLYDICDVSASDTFVGGLLLCFSVRRNWQRLVAPPSDDPAQRRLLSLSGYRVIHTVGVLLAHAGIGAHYALKNPEFVEQTYSKVSYMLLYRSVEMLHTFFIISAVLLSYNIMSSEAHMHWWNIHKVLLRRWLRFTPTYALVIFFYATWARRLGEGPFWKATVEVEANDCRRDWWLHLLYIHNYVDNSRCMMHSWYMAVDMQLTAVGVGVFFLMKGPKARRAAIFLLLILGLAIPPAVIFFKNLHPVFILTPELFLNWVAHDPTFNSLYKPGHTNLVCYVLGLALGWVIYGLRNSDFGAEKYKKHRLIHWLLLPSVAVLQLTGAVFYDPRAAVPAATRLLYSSVIRLVTGTCLCLHVLLTVVSVGGVQSNIYTWRGWTPLARLTFCVYLLHMSVLRLRVGFMDATYQASGYTVLQSFVECTIVSFLLAVPMFLLVEAPFGHLTKLFFAGQKKHAD